MSYAGDITGAPAPAAAEHGLSEQEVLARRAHGQGNTGLPPTSRSYWQIVRENVFTFINICLFGLGLALALLGRYGDALVSTTVISLNVIVSVVQEVRAKRALDRIALLTRPTATVVREGRAQHVPPEALVVDDVLEVAPGDQVIVDGEVIGGGRMAVDESLLTGETDLVPKQGGDPVYSGTFCVTGTARYVATAVGVQSVAHQMTAGARSFRRVLTPLQREIHLVIRIALLIVLYFEFLLVVISLLQRVRLAEGIENATIVAGLVPNGLFLSIAVAYALGAVRILRFGALVQQSNAIESLSHVDVLCLDKTGTLTANRLQVESVSPCGIGEQELGLVLGTLAASTTTTNKTIEAIAAAWPALRQGPAAEVPFSSARKWSALAFDGSDESGAVDGGLHGVYALGAQEMLRPYLELGDEEPDTGETAAQDDAQRDGAQTSAGVVSWQVIADQAQALAERGLRVLLLAHGDDPHGLDGQEEHGDAARLPAGMRPLGLVALRDELRPEAREALAAFMRAGVRPKIISGDNPETVAALARQAGLPPDVQMISGQELERMDEAQLSAAAESMTIFGRITPQQKERLVRALCQRGHYVAMIGDGVNDVLSLKQAQLAIAMQGGSQAARSVSDIVLMHDSFAVLVPAVMEGQRILNGMQDILKLFLTRICTVGLVILSSLALGLGVFPLELRQGSLVTLFSVGIPAVILAVWAQAGPTDLGGLTRRLLHFILPPVLLTSMLGLLLFAGTYVLELSQAGVPPARAASAAVPSALAEAGTALTAFLVTCGLLLVIFVRPPTRWWVGGAALSSDRRPAWLAVGMMAVFGLLATVPPLGSLFTLSPLGWLEWVALAVALAVWTVLVRWTWRARLLNRFLGVELAETMIPSPERRETRDRNKPGPPSSPAGQARLAGMAAKRAAQIAQVARSLRTLSAPANMTPQVTWLAQHIWVVDAVRGLVSILIGLAALSLLGSQMHLLLFLGLGVYLLIDGVSDVVASWLARRRHSPERTHFVIGAVSILAAVVTLVAQESAGLLVFLYLGVRMVAHGVVHIRHAVSSLRRRTTEQVGRGERFLWLSGLGLIALGLVVMVASPLLLSLFVWCFSVYLLLDGCVSLWTAAMKSGRRGSSRGGATRETAAPDAPMPVTLSEHPRALRAVVFVRRTGAYGLGHVAWAIEWPNGWFTIGSVENFAGAAVVPPDTMGFWVAQTLDPVAELMNRPFAYPEYKVFFVDEPRPRDAWEAIVWLSHIPYSIQRRNCEDDVYDVLRAYGATNLDDTARMGVPNEWYDTLPGPSYSAADHPVLPLRPEHATRLSRVRLRTIYLTIPADRFAPEPAWRSSGGRAWYELEQRIELANEEVLWVLRAALVGTRRLLFGDRAARAPARSSRDARVSSGPPSPPATGSAH